MATTTRTLERETFLADVLTTAESSIRAWAHVQVYRWHLPGLTGGGAIPAPGGGGNAYLLGCLKGTGTLFFLSPGAIEAAVTTACGPALVPGMPESSRVLVRCCATGDGWLSEHGHPGRVAADHLAQLAACGHVFHP